MQRINPVDPVTAGQATSELLADVEASLGTVPNIFATMGQSSALLSAYLGFSQALGSSSISSKLSEQIALAVAGLNQCEYCASAHTALGSLAGVDQDEMAENLRGNSSDPRTKLVLDFASEIVTAKGHVSDTGLMLMRTNGFSEQQILEIFGLVMANIITNYFNHLAGTEIDFPVVTTRASAAAAA